MNQNQIIILPTRLSKKRRKPRLKGEGDIIKYYPPNRKDGEVIRLKTFQIRYDKKLSSIAKLVLNSFQKKYIYYAIDDLLYSFKSTPSERENLLAILYSPVLSLHNNFSDNFSNIWIHEIYITKVSKTKINKFLKNEPASFEPFSYITIKLLYTFKRPIKKPDSLW